MSVTITRREKKIFYGYVFGVCPDTYPDTETAATALIEAAGIRNPYDPETGDTLPWAKDNEAACDAYWEALRTAEKNLPVSLGTHGSDAVPTPYLHINGTERDTPRSVTRATPELPPIPVTGRPVDPTWKQTLDEFLAAQDINPPTGDNQPGWWSAAYEDRD